MLIVVAQSDCQQLAQLQQHQPESVENCWYAELRNSCQIQIDI